MLSQTLALAQSSPKTISFDAFALSHKQPNHKQSNTRLHFQLVASGSRKSARAQKRLLLLFVLLLGFAARLYAFDTTYIDADRANVHGIGLVILDKLETQKFDELPLFSDPSSIRLPNGPLVAYLLALVALADRSLTVAVAFGLMLNALVVPLVFVAGRMFVNWQAGWIAALLAAMSNWAVYLARGTWHPTYIEIGSVLAFVLLARGMLRTNNRMLACGFFVAMLVAAGDMKGFAVPLQALLATTVIRAYRPPLRRGWIAGIAMFVVFVLGYVLALRAGGQLGLLADNGLTGLSKVSFSEAERDARDITQFNRDIFAHVLRLASGADYARIWTAPNTAAHALLLALNAIGSLAITALTLLGAARAFFEWRIALNRLALAWVLPACLFLAALTLASADFRIPPYYALSASPVPYVLAALGAATLAAWLRNTKLLMGVLAALVTVSSTWNFAAAAQTVYQQPLSQVRFMPLLWTRRLGDVWKHQCSFMSAASEWWELSLIESPQRVRYGGAHNNQNSSLREFPPQGGDCALANESGYPLPNSETLRMPLENGGSVNTYRSLPYAPAKEPEIESNLGWSLLEFDATLVSNTVRVRHVWRVDRLPNEPYFGWFYTPFIKLVSADGAVVARLDGASSMEGWEWRLNNIVVSEAQLPLPADHPSGEYVVRATLFDPNQKKNAVYFYKNAPDGFFLELTQKLVVKP